MKKLSINEMKQTKAGGLSMVTWAIISAAISFFGGFLDGYTRPYKCR